jgi:hypothetical protein
MAPARLMLLAVTALSVLAFGAPSAHAQDAVGSCVLVPATTIAQISPIASIPSDLTDAPGLLDVGAAGFTFNGDAVCAGIDGSPVAQVYNVNGVGDSANLICGTGTAQGTVALVGGRVHFLDFAISFTAGTGYLTFLPDDVGAGVVELTPTTTGGNCVTTDVTQFFIQGAFSVRSDGIED